MSFHSLLAPPDLAACIIEGGAQLIEKRTEGKTARFILVPDEDARGDFLSQPSDEGTARKYTKYLKNLRWARDSLWYDSRMQPYLLSDDPNLWPAIDNIQSAVEVVSSLKNTVDKDFHGAETLHRACAIIRREVQYVGLHTLQEISFTGKLIPYAVQQPGELLEKVDSIPLAATALRVQLDERVYYIPDVLTMRFVPSALKKLSSLVMPRTVATEPQRLWTELVEKHRLSITEHGPGLFITVQDATHTFHWREAQTTRLMQHAADAGARVRLLSGVFATVVHWTEVSIVLVRRTTPDITPDEARAIEPYASQSIIQVSALSVGEDTDTLVSRAFVSPLVKIDSIRVEKRQVSEHVTVVQVTADSNPFIVVHGNKMRGGFEGHTDVLNAYKRQRDDFASRETALRKLQRAFTDKDPASATTAPASTEGSGEASLPYDQLLEEVRKAVLGCLAANPMTKAQLLEQKQISMFKKHPLLENVLKHVLRTCAELKSRKYQLKE